MHNYLLIGRGVSGSAGLALAAALGAAAKITTDAEAENTDWNELFAGVTDVVVSPGVLPWSKLLQEAKRRNLPVMSELAFGAKHFPGRMVAVTGTNGKTTTVELTTHILESLGANARYAGNIGLPLSEISAQILKGEISAEKLIAVVEVSSFQLEHTPTLGAEAAIILNVESDHLNRYPGGMQEYREVKERIFAGVKSENRLYGITMAESKENTTKFAMEGNTLTFSGKTLLDLRETALNAPHNRENLMAALALAERVLEFSGREAELAKAIKAFQTGKHRLELVAEASGVRYIDDSKATNPSAVVAALKTLVPEKRECVELLAGGLDKGMDFSSLAAYAGYLRKLVVYGACQEAVANGFDCPEKTVRAQTFEEAFQKAAEAAKTGDIVLLSPAAASMDMFKDYKARGEAFAKCAREYIAKK